MTVAQGVAHRGSREGRGELSFGILIHGCRHGIRHKSWSGEPDVGVCATGRCKLSLADSSAHVTSPSAFVILQVCVRLSYQSFWSSDHAVRPWPCPLITAANPRNARRRQRLSTSQAKDFWSAANAACRLRDWRGLTKAATDVLIGIYCAFPSLSTRFRYPPRGDTEY